MMATVDPTADLLLRLLDWELRRPEEVVGRRELKAVDRDTRNGVFQLDQLMASWAGRAKDWDLLNIWLDERLMRRPVDAPRRSS